MDEWPDNFDDEEEDFADELLTEEEAERRLEEWAAEMRVVALKAGRAILDVAEAARRVSAAVGRMVDNAVLSQSEVAPDSSEGEG